MGGKDVDVNLDNIKLDIASDSNIDVTSDSTINAGIQTNLNADLNSDSNINIDTSNIRTELVLPQPLRMENRFAITEPIVTQSSSDIGLDIRPVVMDFCLKFEIGKLPPTCIRQPYQHHFGITLFGVEILGFNFAGESQVEISEVQKQPQVTWGGQSSAHHGAHHHPHAREADGLQIRVGE